MIEAAVFSGEFQDRLTGEDSDYRWFARITFKCPCCARRQRVERKGIGHLPVPEGFKFDLKCNHCGASCEVVPYGSPLLKQKGQEDQKGDRAVQVIDSGTF